MPTKAWFDYANAIIARSERPSSEAEYRVRVTRAVLRVKGGVGDEEDYRLSRPARVDAARRNMDAGCATEADVALVVEDALLDPCDPPRACVTDGRCWTHTDGWADPLEVVST